jgi:putative inorganic carbon (HCO3(-)) transporter
VTAELARLGGPLGSAGLVLLLVAHRRDLRLAGLCVWAAGALLLAVYLAPHGHHRVYAAAAVVGLLLAAGVGVLYRRWPWLVAVSALACVPARIPVTIGHTDANLLLPLYGVVAGAALVLGYELVRGDPRSRELGVLAWPLALYAGWTGLSLAWSKDLRQGAIELLFFYLPFGLLAIVLARLPWSRRALGFLYGQLAAMAVVFAGIGVYQYATRDVFWNPKVIVGNAYAPFYRVNSVFWDPSIYGRFLVVAIVVSLVLVLYERGRQVAVAAAAAIVAAWIGLLFSFSQSSFAALIVAVLTLAVLSWGRRAVMAAALVGAVLLLVGVSAPQVRHTFLDRSGTGLNHASSGRLSLVENGGRIALHHAGIGVGVGGFRRAYAERTGLRGREPKAAASHDTPVTVAAETGLPGLLLFAWLLFAALRVSLVRVRRTFAGRTALAVGIALGVLLVHSLFYNALFEDPTTWGLFGLAVLAATAAATDEVRSPVQDAAQ